MTKAPIPCCSKFVFVIFRFPDLFTCQGLLVLQFGAVKTGGWGAGWNGAGEVYFTPVLHWNFTNHFTPAEKRTYRKETR